MFREVTEVNVTASDKSADIKSRLHRLVDQLNILSASDC